MMPELPEVETVCRSLRPLLIGKTIQECNVFMTKIVDCRISGDFSQLIKTHRIEEIVRRGKYIQIFLSGDMVMVIHLRMTGKLLVMSKNEKKGKYAHVCFLLDEEMCLYYEDIRQFGRIVLMRNEDLSTFFSKLGPEPLSDEFTAAVLTAILQKSKQNIKTFLLDQHKIAGIGNIYADEILFQAKIHPESIACHIKDPQIIGALHHAIQDRLTQGILFKGSSIKDYVDANGEAGNFQQYHNVYGKGGKPCLSCGNVLLKSKMNGRSSVYCDCCQIKY